MSQGYSRARSSTTTTSRYKQEYPPAEECIATFMASPRSMRRASSEGKLAVRYQRGVDQKGVDQRGVVSDLDETNEHDQKLKATHDIGSQVWEAAAASQQEATTTTNAPSEENVESHFNMEFESCIEEHPHMQVLPKLMHFLSLSYKYTKLVVYCIFLILVGVPMTFVWGCVNGSTVFCCVWMWGPTLKLIKLTVHSCAPAIVVPVQVICTPIVDVFARMLRQLRLQAIILGQPTLEKFTSRIENA